MSPPLPPREDSEIAPAATATEGLLGEQSQGPDAGGEDEGVRKPEGNREHLSASPSRVLSWVARWLWLNDFGGF